jgi:hypothetical protein
VLEVTASLSQTEYNCRCDFGLDARLPPMRWRGVDFPVIRGGPTCLIFGAFESSAGADESGTQTIDFIVEQI